jgi:glutamyl-tRNA synthetase
MNIVTRFAPSPTGYLHIGGIRTALFSWAYAKKNKGKFILRIEDTDVERSTPEAVEIIKNGMKWLKLDYDGDIIFQTQRFDRYKELIQVLLDQGDAYYCYTSKAELDELRELQVSQGVKPKYDGRWRPEENKELPDIPDNIQPVIRFKTPKNGEINWKDLVKGEVVIKNEELDDLIIARSDGTPTYNFCVVVDDWDMEVTHVIRGDDHINNTPRQINLLKALNAPIPQYAHLSMILASDGQKLSKRHGAASVMQYKDDGYLPEAVINYLARLGWSHGDDEIFSTTQLSEWFDFDHITSSAAQFDQEKLDWINNHYIKNEPVDKLADLIKPRLIDMGAEVVNKEILNNAIKLYQDREKNLNVFADDILFFFKDINSSEELKNKYLDGKSKNLIKVFVDGIEKLSWTNDDVNKFMKEFVKKQDIKFPEIAMPLRIIIAGTDNTPSIGSIIFILGIEEVKKRISVILE